MYFNGLSRKCGFFCLIRRPASLECEKIDRLIDMSRKDDITGRGPKTGNHVSHANNKAKRTFNLNLQKKRFYLPEQDRWVTLKVSAKTLKTINKNGITAVLDEARRQGVRV